MTFLILSALLFFAACGHNPVENLENSVNANVTSEITEQDILLAFEKDEQVKFTTTIRVHPDMQEFTITRIVGDYDGENWLIKYIITNYMDGSVKIEFEAREDD